MIQGLILKVIIKAVIKAVRRAPDEVIDSAHELRIRELEKIAHPQKELKCKCCKNKECK